MVTGRVSRIVMMSLHTYTLKRKMPPSDGERGGGKASIKLFRNAPRPWFVFFVSPCFFFRNELETARRKHPLPERECIAAATCIEPLGVFFFSS